MTIPNTVFTGDLMTKLQLRLHTHKISVFEAFSDHDYVIKKR